LPIGPSGQGSDADVCEDRELVHAAPPNVFSPLRSSGFFNSEGPPVCAGDMGYRTLTVREGIPPRGEKKLKRIKLRNILLSSGFLIAKVSQCFPSQLLKK
jgi:hypothetical protein